MPITIYENSVIVKVMATLSPVILVADDDKDFRQILTDFLTAKGFQVKTASNGEEALATARELHPGLVLLDVDMPKKDGFQVTFELMQDPHTKGIKIMYLSNLGETNWGKAAEVNRRMAKQIGAVDYFKKGGNLEHLLTSVREHLAS